MRINIVCYEDTKSWILGKFALKMQEELNKLSGVECVISGSALNGYDVTHHIIYSAPLQVLPGLNTAMVTHIDDATKLKIVKKIIGMSVHCICMSQHTVQSLMKLGCDSGFLSYVHPSHDFDVYPRKINLLITSRLYNDGRKNEDLLVQLADHIDSRFFQFTIMGEGWEAIVKRVRARGVEVTYHDNFNKEKYRNLFSTADYYLYFGFDEGSMGYLDALYAGVVPVVSAQGFHKDIANSDVIFFANLSELIRIFGDLSNRILQRRELVAKLDWANYAKTHLALWENLKSKKHHSAKSTFSTCSGLSLMISLQIKRALRKLKM